jgi:tetratricopeptide (TPR) repeat protein
MRLISRFVLLFSLISCFALSTSTRAQDEPRAAWLVTGLDIAIPNLGTERALNARATIAARNVGRGAGSTLTVRINSKAEIKSVTVGSATATYQSRPPRGNSQQVTINLPSSVPSGQIVQATIEYRLPVTENTGVATLSATGSQFLPQSVWYPQVNNELSIRGADYAPFRLTINGAAAVSSGVEKSAGGNSAFDQGINAQPFFVTGTWDRVDGSANAKGISAYLPKGADADERRQAETLIALASDARSFYGALFGPAPDIPIRMISVTRGGGFENAGAVLLGEGAFHRKTVDASTAMTIAEAVARLWIGADTPVRGEGHGVLDAGLTRFVATLFIEKQFGADEAEAERGRERVAYESIAKRDGPLSRSTPADPAYLNSVANKGAMVWRLIDHVVGRDAFAATTKALLASGKTDPDGLTLAAARAAFASRGGAALKALIDQELDQATDMDLMAGLPVQQAGQWTAALRNLGSMDVTVNVVATTSAGQRLTTQATVPGHDFGQAAFKNASNITSVEIDPEKFYPQLDYANDVAPRIPEVAASLGEANRLYGAQEYAKSESLARQMLSASPRAQEARIILGRALLAENKNEEAEREFKQLLAEKLPLPTSLAWGSYGLGEVALRRGQAAEASRLFTDAVRADAEYASTLAARAERIRSESTPVVDPAVTTFINQLDAAVRTGRQAEIAPLIMPGELGRFVQQLVGTQPEAWQTRVLRTEQMGADRVLADVTMNTKQLGVAYSGTAVLVLARAGSSLRLEAIEFFEVRPQGAAGNQQ